MKKLNTSLLLVWLLLYTAPALPDDSPGAVIESFHASLVEAMQAGDYTARLAVIDPAVRQHFQAATIARISLGRNWRTMQGTRQDDFTRLMQELVSSTYASRFTSYNGQHFATHKTEDLASNRKRVKTTLTTSTESVSLDYQLQQTADGWRIYDIVANGVSDLSLKRSNYAALFAEGGLEAVENEIRRNISENEQK